MLYALTPVPKRMGTNSSLPKVMRALPSTGRKHSTDARASPARIARMDASAAFVSTVPILQSPAWAAVQRALGRTVHERSGDGWQYLAIVERGRLGSRLYTPLGPAVSSVEALGAAVADLRALAADAGVDFLR